MADAKLSELTAATTAAGTDSLYLVQSSASRKITVANLFADVVFNCGNEKVEKEVAQKILELCDKFPVYK